MNLGDTTTSWRKRIIDRWWILDGLPPLLHELRERVKSVWWRLRSSGYLVIWFKKVPSPQATQAYDRVISRQMFHSFVSLFSHHKRGIPVSTPPEITTGYKGKRNIFPMFIRTVQKWDKRMDDKVNQLYLVSSNSLIIDKENTKKISTVTMVWILDLN